MANDDYYIGIDIGGTLLKVVVFSQELQEVSVLSSSTELLATKKGQAERDMLELWQKTVELIKENLKKCSLNGNQIKGVSFSAHGKGLYLVDENLQPLNNAILSADNRAIEVVSNWKKNGISDKLYELTKQVIWPAHPIAQLKWLQINQPELVKKSKYILMAHDFIRLKMTNNIGAEKTNMFSSGLVNIHSANYDDDILQLVGLEEIKDKLPPLVDSTAISGYVSKECSKLTGLTVNTPIYGGLFDVVAAAMGSGIVDDSVLSATMGTWSITTTVLDSLQQTNYNYIWGSYGSFDKYFVHEASVTSASNLSWIIKELFHQNIDILDDINKQLELNFNYANEILFLPFLFSSNIDDKLGCSIFNLHANDSNVDVIQAIYEGILFAHMEHLDKITKLNSKADTIVITGGATRSPIWMQMFADLSNLKVIVNKTLEVAAKGAVLCCFSEFKQQQSFEKLIGSSLNYGRQFYPRNDARKYIVNKYEKYKLLVNALLQI